MDIKGKTTISTIIILITVSFTIYKTEGTNSGCILVSVDRIQELRDEIEDRMHILRLLGVHEWTGFPEITSEEPISDVSYLKELRSSLMQLTRYFWNLERVDPAPNMI